MCDAFGFVSPLPPSPLPRAPTPPPAQIECRDKRTFYFVVAKEEPKGADASLLQGVRRFEDEIGWLVEENNFHHSVSDPRHRRERCDMIRYGTIWQESARDETCRNADGFSAASPDPLDSVGHVVTVQTLAPLSDWELAEYLCLSEGKGRDKRGGRGVQGPEEYRAVDCRDCKDNSMQDRQTALKPL